MNHEQDAELRVMETILSALRSLDDDARLRVVDYVLQRIGLRSPSESQTPTQRRRLPPDGGQQSLVVASYMDIKSLTQVKSPRSANEMAAIVAYYLLELAPDEERKETISKEDIERYFVQAGYRLPKATRFTLPNAAAANYLDPVSRGQYKLSPDGFNLVAHVMPGGPVPFGAQGAAQVGRTDGKGRSARRTRARSAEDKGGGAKQRGRQATKQSS